MKICFCVQNFFNNQLINLLSTVGLQVPGSFYHTKFFFLSREAPWYLIWYEW